VAATLTVIGCDEPSEATTVTVLVAGAAVLGSEKVNTDPGASFRMAVPMESETVFGGAVECAASLTVTVNENGLPVAVVGVPLMTPLLELSDRPGGSDPLVMVQAL